MTALSGETTTSSPQDAMLDESDQRFQTLVQISPTPLMIADTGMFISQVNEAFCDLLGTDPESALGDRWIDLFPESERVRMTNRLATALLTGTVEEDTYAFVLDKVERLIRIQFHPASVPGKGVGFVGTLKDVTEREVVQHTLPAGVSREELRNAVTDGTLVLEYQPILRFKDQRVVGVEALLRWNHPLAGIVSPIHFIPVAHHYGFLNEITRFVMRESVRSISSWRSQLGPAAPETISVNVPPSYLANIDVTGYVVSLLEEFDVPASSLILEITEDTFMQDRERCERTMRGLRYLGIGFSVDDFGTGYSSLSALTQIPITQVKIDKSFIDRLESDSCASDVCRTIVELAHTMGLEVVAEGIETEAQAGIMTDVGCDFAQGWLYAKSMPTQELERWLQSRA